MTDSHEPHRINENRPITSRYWTCQIAGWLGYSTVGMAINLLNGAALGPLLVGHGVLVACSIGLTHRLRGYIRRQRRDAGLFGANWPLLAARVLAISIVQTGAVIGVNVALTRSTWTTIAVVALWWGMLVATGGWTLLYVRFSERRRHALKEAQLQLALRDAELIALQTQINPHFLFNCLNSIRALITIDPARAQDMLTRLANVLRSSLRHDRAHTVPLATELAIVADYLALEAVRFEERLQSDIVADADVAQCHVPPLVLQTLVENAIKHGIAHVAGAGLLTVHGEIDEGFLRLTVENTGTLDESPQSPERLGLANVRQRLRLLYGEQASVSLERAKNRVRASVLIPVAR